MVSILVVDDSITERTRVAGLLSTRADVQVTSVSNGLEALDAVGLKEFDLVLTDLQMPEMTGLQLVEKLAEQYPRLPVILMTSYGSEEIAVEAMKAGAASYINKASPPHWMHENVNRVLAARIEQLAHAQVLRHLQIEEYEFCLNNSRTLMSSTASFLRKAIQSLELCPEKDLLRVGIAIEEALLNACLHGNLGLDSELREGDGVLFESMASERSEQEPWQSRCVRVHATLSRDLANIVICDEGDGFDPAKLPDPTDPENLLKPHGRGIMMMRLFLDEVEWNDRGNKVTLTKKLERP